MRKKWYKDKKNLITILITFWGIFIGLFSLIEILDRFGLEIFTKEESGYLKFIIYIMISLVITLCVAIYKIDKFYNQEITEPLCDTEDNVSLMNMISEAFDNGRHMEVIKLGNAVIDSLWYSDKYKLRKKIARRVKDSAELLDDNYCLAKVLIEDLGNGTLEVERKPDSAIRFMKEGVEIAEENNFYFLCARGNRNLACAYVLKSQKSINDEEKRSNLSEAEKYSVTAQEYIAKIEVEGERIDAEASILYVKNKIEVLKGDYEESIVTLKKIEDLYDKLLRIASYKYKAEDRLVKVYREKGMNLLRLRDKKRNELVIELNSNGNITTERTKKILKEIEDYETQAIKILRKAKTRSIMQKNYNNILIVCNILIKYYMDTYSSERENDIKELIDNGERYINRVEIEEYKKTFNNLREDFLKMKDNL